MRYVFSFTMAAVVSCLLIAGLQTGSLAGNHSGHHSGHHSGNHSGHRSGHNSHGADAEASRASLHEKMQNLSSQHEEYLRSYEELQTAHQNFIDTHQNFVNAVHDGAVAIYDGGMSVGDMREYVETHQDVAEKASVLQNVIAAQKAVINGMIEDQRGE